MSWRTRNKYRMTNKDYTRFLSYNYNKQKTKPRHIQWAYANKELVI